VSPAPGLRRAARRIRGACEAGRQAETAWTLPGEASGAATVTVIASLLGRSKKEGDKRWQSLIRMIDVDKTYAVGKVHGPAPLERRAEVR